MNNSKLWLVFFIFTASSALFVQFIILPVFFPSWHAGDGLLVSSLDSRGFHSIAVELSQKIRSEGWSSWELRPQGQAPAGIAAAIYALTIPKLWVFIPLNAALHATAALLIFLIMCRFLNGFARPLICSLPFLLYPSASIWYAQLHKDGFVIAGFMFFLYGWLIISNMRNQDKYIIKMSEGSMMIFSGLFLIWMNRPYLLKIMSVLSILTALALGVKLLYDNARKGFSAKARRFLFVFFILAISAFLFGSRIINSKNCNRQVLPLSASDIKTKPELKGRSPFVSGRIIRNLDSLFREISCRRRGFLLTKGLSNIDSNIEFTTPKDLVLYMPRAALIVFFAPFPSQWFHSGSYESNTVMRRISAFEMIGVYFCLIFLVYALWIWKNRVETWIILFFCSVPMLAYGIVVCNIGTLYRLRYGFLMVLVAFGLAGAFEFFRRRGLLRKTEKGGG